MIRRFLLWLALGTIHVTVSPATGKLTIRVNGRDVPKGVQCYVSWPGRPGIR